MGDKYRCYEALSQNESEDEEYEIVCLVDDRDPRVVVMAPHGGGIERGTSPLARQIAGEEFALYMFNGKKKTGNWVLHITSTRFDEPRAVALVERAEVVLAIHGVAGGEEFVMVGGGDEDLVEAVEAALGESRIRTKPPKWSLAGRNPRNICNRSPSGRGAQLEISRDLRDALVADEGRGEEFAAALRAVLRAAV